MVTNGVFSDRVTTETPVDERMMRYRLSRREDDFRIKCSRDGVTFSQMRVCHLVAATGAVSFGVYACSPKDSSFTTRFDCFDYGPCVLAAHDSQQPDESQGRVCSSNARHQ